MANKKHDILKSLLRQSALDHPSSNFTSSVMQEIEADVQNEVVINSALKSILVRQRIEKPTTDFTRSVMKQVEALDSKAVYKPIISKKTWLIITTVVIGFVSYLGFAGHGTTSPKGLAAYLTSTGYILNSLFTKVSAVPSLYFITFISVSILLLADYLIRTRRPDHEKKSRTFSH